jgi:hypothetical protein
VFAIILVSTVSSYVQMYVLSSEIIIIDDANVSKETSKEAKSIFSKILLTINIAVIGFSS